jgi:hypothetical protein
VHTAVHQGKLAGHQGMPTVVDSPEQVGSPERGVGAGSPVRGVGAGSERAVGRTLAQAAGVRSLVRGLVHIRTDAERKEGE